VSEILVKINKLTKSFGSEVAVNSINLQIKAGEVVALIGPNGAVKSTTMRMITGFLQPDKGEVFIQNNNMHKNPYECKKHIGYLAETSGSYPDLTVREYLSFISNAYDLTNVESKVKEVAKLTRIDSFMDKIIETLSKGMKQRVFLAASLIHNPDILILDEPTEGLDPNQKKEMHTLLTKLAKTKAILLSTHVLEEVEQICSRVIVINKGEIIADETPKAFKKRGGDMQSSFSKLTKEGK
jgi:ABC-2 type transport system ATP-binding protein